MAGFGSRKVDPEPGRCRRTDGKKWRCSKEAYPDSKYCERHMHRGRNRSRKPVEVVVSSSSTTTNLINTSSQLNNNIPSSYNNNRNISMTNSSHNMPSPSSFPFSPLPSSIQSYQNSSLNPFLYTTTQSPPSSRPNDSDFPSQDATTHQLFMDSASYRQINGMREGVDERAFFPEASGSVRSYNDSYQQLSMNSYNKSYSSNSQFHNINDNNPRQEEEQHCFVLGTDFKSTRPISKEKESETTTQRPLHHFFGEWPPKNTDSWLDLASNSRIPSDE